MKFVHDDGGRAAAGYKGQAGDCVVRAIAIATQQPYAQVYDDLYNRLKQCKLLRDRAKSPRNGIPRKVIKQYMQKLGWEWHPRMQIGSGCQSHLREDEVPMKGRIIVSLSRHLCAVVDGAIHDSHDPSRSGTRCVYGYWKAPGGLKRKGPGSPPGLSLILSRA